MLKDSITNFFRSGNQES